MCVGQHVSRHWSQLVKYNIYTNSNNQFELKTMGNFIPFTNTNLALNGGNVTLTDNGFFVAGDDGDMRISHEPPDSIIISETGDLIIDNTNTIATASTIIKLGTSTNATDFQVQNNSGVAQLKVDGAGDVTIDGTITNPQPYSERKSSGNQSINNNSNTKVLFSSITLERDITYSAGIFTVPTDGVYLMEYNVQCQGNANERRITRLDSGGTRYAELRLRPNNTNTVYMGGSANVFLSAGDEVFLDFIQFSGVSLNITGNTISIMRMVGG